MRNSLSKINEQLQTEFEKYIKGEYQNWYMKQHAKLC